MIRVTISMPAAASLGFPARTVNLEITNISILAPISNYAVYVDGREVGVIRGHQRDLGFWPLLERAVSLAGEKRR